MSYTPYYGQQNFNPFEEVTFTTHDYVIGGKLVIGHATYDAGYASLMNTDIEARQRVKFELANQLATYMIENNLVEFTQMDDHTMQTKRVAVRAYLAPNDQIKILRLANKIV